MITEHSQITKHSYLLRIKKLAEISEKIASCAHMIPDDEQDRNGLVEQLIFNQREIAEIIQYFVGEYGG